jgi:hypothetical protein
VIAPEFVGELENTAVYEPVLDISSRLKVPEKIAFTGALVVESSTIPTESQRV